MSTENEYERLPDPTQQYAEVISQLSTFKVDQLIAFYRDKRDELGAKRKAYQQEEADIKDLLSRISMELKDRADAQGVDTFSTQAGVAYRNVKTKYRLQSGQWDTFVQFMKDTNNFSLVEKRPAKLAVAEVHKETGVIPPGLDYFVEIEFNVRKPSNK